MPTNNHIIPAITTLMNLARAFPDLRLGQLLVNATSTPAETRQGLGHLFYIENDKLTERLRAHHAFLKENSVQFKRSD